MASGISTRDLVHRRLSQQCRVYPDLPTQALTLDEAEAHGLDGRDAALAVAIEQSVARYWMALVTILQHHLTRPWDHVESKLQAVLLSGAAQLLLLDRVPDHAAIDESVRWAKVKVRPKAGGMVNAVLRKVASARRHRMDTFDGTSRSQLPLPDGGALSFTEDIFAADATERLAQQTSHPIALLRRWIQALGRTEASEVALHGLVQPPTIVVDVENPPSSLADALTPHIDAGCFVFTGSRAQLNTLLESCPAARVQDPSSAMPARRTAGLAPTVIIDYCAGLGTKTRQLAALHRQAQIIATDRNDQRRAALHRQFEHVDRITVVEPSAMMEYAGRAELLMLDVPCSNTGVLARRVEARHRWSEANQKKLVELQRQIIADALPLLADSGYVLYCTCSIEQAENHQQIEWFIKWHDFDVTDEHQCRPAGLPGDPPTSYRDGSFAALLRR